MDDGDDLHDDPALEDSVEDPVLTAPSGVQGVERFVQLLTDSMRVSRQRSHDELERRRGHLFG